MAEQEEKGIMKAIAVSVAIVILGVISALIVGEILSSSVFSQGQINGTNTNEALGAVDNITNTTFAIITTQPAANCTLGTINNATSGEVLLATNYTFVPTACTLILTITSEYIGETLNATYNFTFFDTTGSTIIDVNAIKTLFGEFIDGLLGFLGIIGIVLGVIWLIMYVAKLFKKGGLNDLGQTA